MSTSSISLANVFQPLVSLGLPAVERIDELSEILLLHQFLKRIVGACIRDPRLAGKGMRAVLVREFQIRLGALCVVHARL
jgi:hypothetical protein